MSLFHAMIASMAMTAAEKLAILIELKAKVSNGVTIKREGAGPLLLRRARKQHLVNRRNSRRPNRHPFGLRRGRPAFYFSH